MLVARAIIVNSWALLLLLGGLEFTHNIIYSLFSLQTVLVWAPSFPSLSSSVGSSCRVRDVGPLPPDPVEDLQLISVLQRFTTDRRSAVVTVQFNWTAPDFTGEEIVGYQVWLDKQPVLDNVTRFVTHGALARTAEIEMTFEFEDTDFFVILQVYIFLYNSYSDHLGFMVTAIFW